MIPFLFKFVYVIIKHYKMNLKDLVLKTRSYRRFDESHQIDTETLENLIDLARLSASGGKQTTS